ncbi:outer membrane beta-barrel protein [Proteus columbae]|uniref:outer membrane beta-barrel protein n=1 Tax=Proteus columbae TaxID=1987580 RepID=UPI000C1E1F74|nr:outer membrane beta-barrel protein [Proteus columbae]
MFIKNSISALLLSSIFISSPLLAENNNNLISLGYAYVKVKEAPALNGISLKLQSQPNSKKIAGQFSAIIAQKSFSNNQRLRYASLSMGPVYALTPYLELYGTLGVSGLGYKVKTNKKMNDNAGSVSWGAGVTFTPYKNMALIIGYEGSYFKIAERHLPTNTLIANLGYRF